MKNALPFVFAVMTICGLTSCQKENCGNMDCLNGGYCESGFCQCPDGYTGADCGQQIAPKEVQVYKIEITHFAAATASNQNWDPTGAPDLMPRLYLNDVCLWSCPEVMEDANPHVVYEHNLVPCINLYVPKGTYTLRLEDYDGPQGNAMATDQVVVNDIIGEATFTPYTGNGFPTLLQANNGNMEVKLYVMYRW